MRWKVVFRKKPTLASATIEAAAFGPRFRSSVTVKSPQLVLNSSVHVLPASSGFDGFFCLPGLRGVLVTCRHPLAVAGVARDVCGLPALAGMSAVLELLLDPQPAIATTRTAAGGRRRRRAKQSSYVGFARRSPSPLPPSATSRSSSTSTG